jgi:dTDP-glucose 4,6-dehydratase
MKTKVLVIGSNSFSGSDFIDLLLEKGDYSVFGVSRSYEKSPIFLPYRRHNSPNFQFEQVDLNKDLPHLLRLITNFDPRYIVNFAAQSEVAPSWKNPGQWFQTNAVALTELADGLRNRPSLERYVHISSPEVYGTCEGVVKEDGLLNPSTPYAASKAAGDLSLFTYFKNFKLPLVMIYSNQWSCCSLQV